MNIKRLIAAGAGAAMILGATAIPALASVSNGDGGGFTLIKNKAWVKNITVTKADTGDNAIGAGRDVSGGSITTGAAVAGASIQNVVNWNEVDPCGCDGVTIIKNKAKVKNVTITKADTGGNAIVAGRDVNGGSIGTGDATAGSVVENAVNTNIVGFVL